MAASISQASIDKFTTFGDFLRFLRRRAGITQLELSIAVGYSDAQISRLEQNLRLPDIPTIETCGYQIFPPSKPVLFLR